MVSQLEIVVYGTGWCGDCYRVRHFLKKHAVCYQWINIDNDREAEKIVLKINNGLRSVPTIVFNDGTILVEPSNATLAEKLNL